MDLSSFSVGGRSQHDFCGARNPVGVPLANSCVPSGGVGGDLGFETVRRIVFCVDRDRDREIGVDGCGNDDPDLYRGRRGACDVSAHDLGLDRRCDHVVSRGADCDCGRVYVSGLNASLSPPP